MRMSETPARVRALFVSPRRSYPMTPRTAVTARTDHGLDGDAHARPGGSRQVLLLDSETLTELGVAPGALKENITTEGLRVAELQPGTRLRVGAAALEITKECKPCEFVESVQAGMLPKIQGRRGMLARVVEGGPIQVGDAIQVLTAEGQKADPSLRSG